MPPLSGSQLGACVLTDTVSAATAAIVAAETAKRFVRETIGHLVERLWAAGYRLSAIGFGLKA
jgi:thermostable 8-oxoguanine DNA glycosylase